MRTLKDKRKFGWDKQPKNRNCKKGIQGHYHKDRNTLHKLLFRTEGWKENNPNIMFVVRDIKYYYDIYEKGENLIDFISKYEYDKDKFWKSTNGRYYSTLIEHIEELKDTLKLRGDI